MFKFKLEPDLPLLTATRIGLWSIDTVIAYEVALRRELALLQISGRPTGFIIDRRSTVAQHRDVAEALRSMVAGLGPLRAHRTAVVTSSGVAKLRARNLGDPDAQVFTSMVLARSWVTGRVDAIRQSEWVHDEPSDADAEGPSVHIHGPSDVDVMLTPTAALETATRISNAAVEALLGQATPSHIAI
jgi:hypothetical protein